MAQAVRPASADPVMPNVLSAHDVKLYRELMAAERDARFSDAKTIFAKIDDPLLLGYAEALHYKAAARRSVSLATLKSWLSKYGDLAIADDMYRLAVVRATHKVRRNGKLVSVANVTNIPAPDSVGYRGGGYEDVERPEPTPSGQPARKVMPAILSAISDGKPDEALALMRSVEAQASPADRAILAHRIAASYRAEARDAEAYVLATSIPDPTLEPRLLWDAGLAAWRMGHWHDAETQLEKLMHTAGATDSLHARAAFWAARAYMQEGKPDKVISLLSFAAAREPSFYGLISESILGIDPGASFKDPVLTRADFQALMQKPAARRAVALWQIGEQDYVGRELNRAFVSNTEQLDPAMAALARDIGATNVELRASEQCAARGILLTGLFPVPHYKPRGGYQVDPSLVLAFARIESRFQTGATSPAGARGLMQVMPATARHLGVRDTDDLDDPGTALSVGQRYIEQLLDQLNGNLLELGGAYNAGPGAVARWLDTKAGANDPLLFVESIPIYETRRYVKRLMLYHWLYSRRLGQESPSLSETASGAWPIYHPAHPLPDAPALPTARPAPAVPIATRQTHPLRLASVGD